KHSLGAGAFAASCGRRTPSTFLRVDEQWTQNLDSIPRAHDLTSGNGPAEDRARRFQNVGKAAREPRGLHYIVHGRTGADVHVYDHVPRGERINGSYGNRLSSVHKRHERERRTRPPDRCSSSRTCATTARRAADSRTRTAS